VSGEVFLSPDEREASAYNFKSERRRFTLTILSIIASAVQAGQASAADLPSKATAPIFAPPPSSEPSWTGFYVGASVGGGFDHFAFPYDIDVPGIWGFVSNRSGINASGPFGGLQGGFNYELPFFHVVAGFEIDSSVSGIQGNTSIQGVLINGQPYAATFGSKFEDFGTARLRLGYAWGRFLPYLTAGFTYATTNTYYNVATSTLFASGSITETRTGVFPHVGAFGAGLEYAIDPRFSVKGEYLYEFINARTVLFAPTPDSHINFNTRSMYHVLRAGLNYKFDWLSPAAPIIAKY